VLKGEVKATPDFDLMKTMDLLQAPRFTACGPALIKYYYFRYKVKLFAMASNQEKHKEVEEKINDDEEEKEDDLEEKIEEDKAKCQQVLMVKRKGHQREKDRTRRRREKIAQPGGENKKPKKKQRKKRWTAHLKEQSNMFTPKYF
jgi:hypothetical protein